MEEEESVKLRKDPAESGESPAHLPDEFIREIRELLDQDYTDRIQELCRDLNPHDAAELLIKIGSERARLVDVLESDIDPEAFTHLDHDILNNILDHMTGAQIAGIINALDSDDAINLIDDLDEERHVEVMRSLSRKVRLFIEEGLTFPEYSAGRLMQREFVAIPQFWTVGKTVDYLRAAAEAMPDRFHDIFIVDPMHKFVGSVDLSRILCAQRSAKVDTLVQEDHVSIPVEMDQEDVAQMFRRKDLFSAPVVDEHNRLIGVVTVDDIVDVIDEEAEDDFLKLSGIVSDSDIFRPMLTTVRARFGWLAVNLLTAFAATWVIAQFEGTIQQLVILAALMPIVASMGGNAGTQTLAIAVRALATGELTRGNALRMIGKEILVGAVNGILFGVIMIGVILFWYQDIRLGLIMALALLCNLIAAGFSGAIIPFWLHRAGFDPATSAAVFLTTVTDVVGFFSFLGLAAWWLL